MDLGRHCGEKQTMAKRARFFINLRLRDVLGNYVEKTEAECLYTFLRVVLHFSIFS